MKPIKSKAQIDYLKAKTKFEERSKILEARVAEEQKTAEVEQELMEKLVIETGFHNAFNDLSEAESELISWSHATIKHDKTYKDNKRPIDEMYEKLDVDPQMRARIIQLALRIR
ncbi:hypothetical protein [Saccharibacillus qingshengii]|uniref:hypothetical protein n=1 Tax=Saccharibacillus qingshengii TaxID=1763540 RepID=UPI00155302A3|nr:hypothetical protein [Saccharibacillus qingshengii]